GHLLRSAKTFRRLVALEAAIRKHGITIHGDALTVAPESSGLTRKHGAIVGVALAESVSGLCDASALDQAAPDLRRGEVHDGDRDHDHEDDQTGGAVGQKLDRLKEQHPDPATSDVAEDRGESHV